MEESMKSDSTKWMPEMHVVIKEETDLPDLVLYENEEIKIKEEIIEIINDNDDLNLYYAQSTECTNQNDSTLEEDKKRSEFQCRPCSVILQRCNVPPDKEKPYTEKCNGITQKKREYRCEYCQKTCSGQRRLVDHLRVHTGEKPFKCAKCGKAFSRNDILTTHQLIHIAEKPHKCRECWKGFRQKKDLNRHIKDQHGSNQQITSQHGSRELLHECTECKKNFFNKHQLKSHMVTHTNEKPLECPKCKKKFKTKLYLSKHMQVHSVEKMFECDICHKTFKTRSTIRVHIAKHFGVRPFKCKI